MCKKGCTAMVCRPRGIQLWDVLAVSSGNHIQPQNYFVVCTDPHFSLYIQKYTFKYRTGVLRRNQVKERLSPDGLKHYLRIKRLYKQKTYRPSMHVGRLVNYAHVGSSSQVNGQHFQVAFQSRIRFTYQLSLTCFSDNNAIFHTVRG